MECNICGYKKVTGNQHHMKCPKCGCEQYEPTQKADLHKRQPVTIIDKLLAVLLFKLYDFTVWLNKKVEGEVKKPRFGNP